MAEKPLNFILPNCPLIHHNHHLTHINARLVELVDTLGLEPNARAWGFESLTGHHRYCCIAYVRFKKPGLAPWLFFCLKIQFFNFAFDFCCLVFGEAIGNGSIFQDSF